MLDNMTPSSQVSLLEQYNIVKELFCNTSNFIIREIVSEAILEISIL
jgi:hypothetical protein